MFPPRLFHRRLAVLVVGRRSGGGSACRGLHHNTHSYAGIRRPVSLWMRGGGEERGDDQSFQRIHSGSGHNNGDHDNTDDSDFGDAPYRVYLAVGSNMGNRFENIRQALYLLCQEDAAIDHQAATRTSSTTAAAVASKTKPTRVVRTSFLHETAPMYVTDQPAFLNGAVELATHLSPTALLRRLQRIERQLGRRRRWEGLGAHDCDGGDREDKPDNSDTDKTNALEEPPPPIRNGPRPIDLDILFYQTRLSEAGELGGWRHQVVRLNFTGDASDDDTSATRDQEAHDDGRSDLTIPHPRLQERNFVLQPLLEVAGPSLVHPVLNATLGQLHQQLLAQLRATPEEDQAAVRVLPLTGRTNNTNTKNRFLYWNETLVMGILNVTPDSFSDGGDYHDAVERAAQHALRLVHQDGAAVVDIGGESTRPGASPVTTEEEIRRVIPVIERIRALERGDAPPTQDGRHKAVILSIDTRRAAVAQAAIQAGADIVNDVSGGTFDPEMLPTVARLGVPIILMHMRGTPATMQSMTSYDEDRGGVVAEVARALARTSRVAAEAGIPRWLQIVDPGIGFAKDLRGNLALLRNLDAIREATHGLPLLLGTSRKGFLGTLAHLPVASDRDYATVSSCVAALCLEEGRRTDAYDTTATMLRVHNPAAMVQAVKVMQAIQRGSCE